VPACLAIFSTSAGDSTGLSTCCLRGSCRPRSAQGLEGITLSRTARLRIRRSTPRVSTMTERDLPSSIICPIHSSIVPGLMRRTRMSPNAGSMRSLQAVPYAALLDGDRAPRPAAPARRAPGPWRGGPARRRRPPRAGRGPARKWSAAVARSPRATATRPTAPPSARVGARNAAHARDLLCSRRRLRAMIRRWRCV
jgi:hypothetical protein